MEGSTRQECWLIWKFDLHFCFLSLFWMVLHSFLLLLEVSEVEGLQLFKTGQWPLRRIIFHLVLAGLHWSLVLSLLPLHSIVVIIINGQIRKNMLSTLTIFVEKQPDELQRLRILDCSKTLLKLLPAALKAKLSPEGVLWITFTRLCIQICLEGV